MNKNKKITFTTTSNIERISEILALSYIEDKCLEKSTKTIKNYKDCFAKYRRYELKKINTVQLKKELVTLICNNKEIGYYVKSTYSHVESLSLIYINEQYRSDKDYIYKLVEHFDKNTDLVSMIEIRQKNRFEDYDIYNEFGFKYEVEDFIEEAFSLCKNENDFIEASESVINLTNETTTEKFFKVHCKILNALKNENDYDKSRDLFNQILSTISLDIKEFYHYAIDQVEQGSLYERFLNHSFVVAHYLE